MKFVRGLALVMLMPVVAFAQLPEGEARLPGQTEVKAEPPAEEAKPKEEKAPEEEEKVYLNVQDQDIKEIIKQISKATGRNFIIDAKVTGKITILSNRMMTKNEAYQAFLSSLEVAGFTIVEGPGGIFKIIPLRDAKNYPIPTHVDTTPLSDQYITRLIKLENISASEMAEAIKGLISRNGNLFAYPETNTLVLTDSGTNIDRLMKIIKELDQEGPQETVEIIPLHYASAKEVAGIVLTLFEQEKGQARRPGAGGAEEIAEVSKIIADERTNSIIVLASKRAIDGVKELINRLDAKLEEGAEGKIHVHYLKHAKAADIAEVLASLAGQTAKPAGQAAGQQPAGTVVAELEDFKVAADETTNSLLITSTPKTYQTLVDKVLSKLDIPRKQVYLEAMIIEFILSKEKALGVSAHGGVEGAGALGFGQTFRQLAGLINPLGSGTSPLTAAPGLLGGILARRTVNIQTTDSSGNSQTITVPAFSAFLTALAQLGDTNLVASPNLLALDNEESTIEILTKEPEPGQNVLGPSGLVTQGTPSRIEAGLTLKLTPQITEKGTVRLDIDQKFSFFATPKNTSLGTQAIAERKVKTSVVTNDGQTVVIGGLMQDEVRKSKTKVPLLGDIPILGFLFQQTSSTKSKSNLMLFLTPHIIRDSSDFNKVLHRKLGQQSEFLTKNFKVKERADIETVVRGHNADIADILTGRPGPGALAPIGEGQKQAAADGAVITAEPEEEPLTIVIPKDEKAAKMLEKKAQEEAEQKAKEEKKKKKTEVMEIPPPVTPREEVLATPVEPPVQTPAETPRSDHPPVITLTPGTSPDFED